MKLAKTLVPSLLAGLGLVTVSAAPAGAWEIYGECLGQAIRFEGPLQEMRNACSIPDSSGRRTAYTSAINRWNESTEKSVTAAFRRDPSECFMDLGDFLCETGMGDRENIDDRNGLTSFDHQNICVAPPWMGDYSEADTFIADDMSFSMSIAANRALAVPGLANPASPTGGGAMTIVHELGHQLALDHSSELNVMTAAGARGLRTKTNGTVGLPSPLADDVEGLRILYGTKTMTNVFPVAQFKNSSNQVGTINGVDMAICRGGAMPYWLTTMNTSSSSKTVSYKLTAGPWTVVDSTLTVAGRSMGTTISFALVPTNLPNGTYSLKHTVDSSNSLTESDEGDNHVVFLGRLIVGC